MSVDLIQSHDPVVIIHPTALFLPTYERGPDSFRPEARFVKNRRSSETLRELLGIRFSTPPLKTSGGIFVDTEVCLDMDPTDPGDETRSEEDEQTVYGEGEVGGNVSEEDIGGALNAAVNTDDPEEAYNAGRGVGAAMQATAEADPTRSFHELAGEFERRAVSELEALDALDPDEEPSAWSQRKGALDAYRSAAVSARMVAFSRSGIDRTVIEPGNMSPDEAKDAAVALANATGARVEDVVAAVTSIPKWRLVQGGVPDGIESQFEGVPDSPLTFFAEDERSADEKKADDPLGRGDQADR